MLAPKPCSATVRAARSICRRAADCAHRILKALAEACAECLHAPVRRELWGYAAGETREIESLTIASGALPRRAQELVLDWAELNRQELLEDWRLCMDKQPPKPIAPLK